MSDEMMNNMMIWMMGPWWFLGWILIVGLIVAIILAVVWTVRGAGGTTQQTENPLDILQRRLARGEISPEEFETIKRQLG